jgi:hypothetical protein
MPDSNVVAIFLYSSYMRFEFCCNISVFEIYSIRMLLQYLFTRDIPDPNVASVSVHVCVREILNSNVVEVVCCSLFERYLIRLFCSCVLARNSIRISFFCSSVFKRYSKRLLLLLFVIRNGCPLQDLARWSTHLLYTREVPDIASSEWIFPSGGPNKC